MSQIADLLDAVAAAPRDDVIYETAQKLGPLLDRAGLEAVKPHLFDRTSHYARRLTIVRAIGYADPQALRPEKFDLLNAAMHGDRDPDVREAAEGVLEDFPA